MSAPRYLLSLIACLVVSIGGSTTAGATSRTDAIRLYRRIAGVPPTPAQVTQMAQLLDSGNVEEAARIPLDTDEFINNGAKRMVVPWTDVLGSSQKSIHFSTALMLGLIRDDLPFDQVLYGDSFYVGSAAISSTETTSRVLGRPYITNSGHFANLDNNHLSEPTNPYLLNPDNYDDTYVPDLKQRIFTNLFLVKVPQDGFMTPSYEHYRETAWALQPPYAGIMTAPDFAQAFYSAGTNRRPIKFLMQNFLCKTLEQLMDVNLPDTFVRRDVDRSPGGDSRTYKQRCIGCHSGIDAITGAFGYYDVNPGVGHIADIRSYGDRQYYPGSPLIRIQDKMNRNYTNYPAGHVVMDSSWVNLWVGPKYAELGWRGATSGTGIKELGQMLARSEAFGNCMATHAFEHVCLREPDEGEQSELKSIARRFEGEMNYSMKRLLAKVAAHPQCLGSDQ
jgi:hypothetical protein